MRFLFTTSALLLSIACYANAAQVAGNVPSRFTKAEVIQPQQLDTWTAETLADAIKRPDGVASRSIGSYGWNITTVTTRTKTGEAEQHRDWSDIFVVISGEASLISGGHLDHARTVSAGEMRGIGIIDGTKERLEPGSIVHISPHIPHQLILQSGGHFTYFVIKVKSPDTQ